MTVLTKAWIPGVTKQEIWDTGLNDNSGKNGKGRSGVSRAGWSKNVRLWANP